MKKILNLIIASYLCSSIDAQVRLPKLISNGMVLQRDIPLKIGGWAAPGEKISVMFSANKGKSYQAVANEKGEWSVTLAKQKAGGPFHLKITASNQLVIDDILIGDVWLCSGQSNMEQGMGGRLKYRYAYEIANDSNKYIRHFLVPDKHNYHAPQRDVETGSWKEANPRNIAEFTAVGYFFAKELYATYKIPIGLINASLGGSPAEAWISEGSLKKFPDYFAGMQKFKDDKMIAETESKDRAATAAWLSQLNNADEGVKNNWKDPSLDDAGWEQMQIPGYWANTPAGFFNGIVWFRKEINIPASMSGRAAKIELGRITDADSVFINGKFVGNTTYQYPARRYELNNTVLKEGKNSIVIRVQNNGGIGGFAPAKRYELTTATDTINLTGTWKYRMGAKAEKSIPSTTNIRNQPGGLHNAMIAPLVNYAIKGAIWYQGETNSNYPDNYQSLLQTLIEDWRSKWKNNFPFLFVQLPNFMDAKPTPQLNSNWATLRWQQYQALKVLNTGMVTAIDLGEWNDLHPENKKDISYRLSLLAKAIAYKNKKLVSSGPLYRSMKVEGNKILISFDHTGSGLVSKDNQELRHFAIAGADGKYVKAQALIKNNGVQVWSNELSEPVSVYYAWADNPENVNLYNKEGLPAAPFKTAK